MADKSQRTEQPTAKHRKEVREKGKVARSPELGSWASLLAVAVLLPRLGGLAANRVDSFLRVVLNAVAHPTTSAAMGVLATGLETAAMAALPILLVCTGIGVASSFAQVGLRFTPKALAPQFSRISPRTGFKRVLSTQGAWTLGKTIGKLCILAGMGYVLLHQLMGSVLGRRNAAAPDHARDRRRLHLGGPAEHRCGGAPGRRGGLRLSAAVLPAGPADDQARGEGREPSQRRVPRSPPCAAEQGTPAVSHADDGGGGYSRRGRDEPDPLRCRHCLRPEEGPGAAGGGQGCRCHRRPDPEPGGRARVPIVENPVLARTLHASCQVDDVVPAALYTAVARLLAFVYSLSPTAKMLGEVHRMAPTALGATG